MQIHELMGLVPTVQLVARSKEDIIKARGVKPTLSPNLNTLATVEALDVKRLLFIGVGCQVRPAARQLLRAACFLSEASSTWAEPSDYVHVRDVHHSAQARWESTEEIPALE